IGAGQATGTILNDDVRLTVDSVTDDEGDTGTTTFTFHVGFADPFPSALPVSVHVAPAPRTAESGSDFQSVATTITIAPGATAPNEVSVKVNGDIQPEADETFFLQLSDAENAGIDVSRGVGFILNDDDQPSVDLAVTAKNIQFSPANPAPGDPVTITAT